MKNNKPNISIKIIFGDGKVKRVNSKKRRRIFNFVQANNFQNCLFEVNVAYGKGFHNKGIYKTKEDSINALKIFMEVGL